MSGERRKRKQEVKVGEYQFDIMRQPGRETWTIKNDACHGTNGWDKKVEAAGMNNKRLEVILRVKD